MPPISVLIKPASGLCNMNCRYCFYTDEMQNRKEKTYGIMQADTLEAVLQKVLSHAEKECTIAYQGGEPTLAGLPFFELSVELQKKYNCNHVTIHNAIQTNGYAIDERWARFFAENNFLVGLSLDGIKQTHDAYRVDKQNMDTFEKIIATVRLFNRYQVEYNILTVVNNVTSRKAERIYNFYKRCGFQYLQFIACLDPLGKEPGKLEYSLTPDMYGQFLCDLFDLWYADAKNGKQPYIRSFENYMAMLCGYPPESCDMRGVCGMQYVVEADGSVYPCDFYVLDEYRLGNLKIDSMEAIDEQRQQKRFIEESLKLPTECSDCPFVSLCRGGCRRNRMKTDNGNIENYFCKSYRMFFEHSIQRMSALRLGQSTNIKL